MFSFRMEVKTAKRKSVKVRTSVPVNGDSPQAKSYSKVTTTPGDEQSPDGLADLPMADKASPGIASTPTERRQRPVMSTSAPPARSLAKMRAPGAPSRTVTEERSPKTPNGVERDKTASRITSVRGV